MDGIYNLADQNVEITDIAETIKEEVEGSKIKYQDMKYEDLRDYHVSTEKLKSQTDWNARISLKQSIRELMDLYSSHRIKNPQSSVYHNARYIGEKNGIK